MWPNDVVIHSNGHWVLHIPRTVEEGASWLECRAQFVHNYDNSVIADMANHVPRTVERLTPVICPWQVGGVKVHGAGFSVRAVGSSDSEAEDEELFPSRSL